MSNSKIDQMVADQVQEVNDRRERKLKERVGSIIDNIAYAQNEIASYKRGIKQQGEEIEKQKAKLKELQEAEVFSL